MAGTKQCKQKKFKNIQVIYDFFATHLVKKILNSAQYSMRYATFTLSRVVKKNCVGLLIPKSELIPEHIFVNENLSDRKSHFVHLHIICLSRPYFVFQIIRHKYVRSVFISVCSLTFSRHEWLDGFNLFVINLIPTQIRMFRCN